MKATALFFLKIFTFMSLSYGGSQAFTYYFLGNGEQKFTQALLSGLGFGLLMGLFLTYRQVREVKNLKGKNFTPEDLSVHQVAHFQSSLTKEQILARLQNHYLDKDWNLSENGSEIRLKTTFSWKSFGEKIQIKTEQLQNGSSEVFIESKPRTWITIADYGKNLENIMYLRILLVA